MKSVFFVPLAATVVFGDLATAPPAEPVTSDNPFFFKTGDDCSSLRLNGDCVETTPVHYPNKVHCTIGVTRPTGFRIDTWEIENGFGACQYDSLTINGEKYCGFTKPSVSRTSSEMVWNTDYSVYYEGFKICALPGELTPTEEPTRAPTEEEMEGEPTMEPTDFPPTGEPTWEPTAEPTEEPTWEPTAVPTMEPEDVYALLRRLMQ